MYIALGLICLVAVSVLEGANGFPKQIEENDMDDGLQHQRVEADCADKYDQSRCERWAEMGFCEERFVDWMAENCMKTCNKCPVPVCELQPEIGTGPLWLTRFYYDVNWGQCIKFLWSGLGGNGNRFMTWEECSFSCGFRPYESPEAHREPDNTYLVKNYTRCNDNFNAGWQLQPKALSYSEAVIECNRKSMDLACPWNDNSFIEWLREQGNSEEFWFAGTQGINNYFNYIFWADHHEISRDLQEGNLWTLTNPLYPMTAGCVKGSKVLSVENCSTTLQFYCSVRP